jgi:hypothetical protein
MATKEIFFTFYFMCAEMCSRSLSPVPARNGLNWMTFYRRETRHSRAGRPKQSSHSCIIQIKFFILLLSEIIVAVSSFHFRLFCIILARGRCGRSNTLAERRINSKSSFLWSSASHIAPERRATFGCAHRTTLFETETRILSRDLGLMS